MREILELVHVSASLAKNVCDTCTMGETWQVCICISNSHTKQTSISSAVFLVCVHRWGWNGKRIGRTLWGCECGRVLCRTVYRKEAREGNVWKLHSGDRWPVFCERTHVQSDMQSKILATFDLWRTGHVRHDEFSIFTEIILWQYKRWLSKSFIPCTRLCRRWHRTLHLLFQRRVIATIQTDGWENFMYIDGLEMQHNT